jgi:hypothetical protein
VGCGSWRSRVDPAEMFHVKHFRGTISRLYVYRSKQQCTDCGGISRQMFHVKHHTEKRLESRFIAFV